MRLCSLGLLWVALLPLSPILTAQSGEKDMGGIAAYTGAVFGLGSHPAVGASTGYALSPYVIALFDVAYAPLGTNTLRVYPRNIIHQSRLYDFTFAVTFRSRFDGAGRPTESWAPDCSIRHSRHHLWTAGVTLFSSDTVKPISGLRPEGDAILPWGQLGNPP
jgi:hypothetical protein